MEGSTEVQVYQRNKQHNPLRVVPATGISRRPLSHRHRVLLRVPACAGRKKRVGKSPLRPAKVVGRSRKKAGNVVETGGPYLGNDRITSEEHLLVSTFCASYTGSKPLRVGQKMTAAKERV